MLQTVDAAGRLTLPAGYANAKVAVSVLPDGELVIRRAEIEDRVSDPVRLSDRDRDLLLDMLENPPEPNEALKAAVARFRQQYE